MRLQHPLRSMHHLGPRWWALRAAYALQTKTGTLARRLPRHAWDDRPLAAWLTRPELAEPEAYLELRRADSPRFFFEPRSRSEYGALLRAFDTTALEGRRTEAPDEAGGACSSAVAQAEEIVAGFVRLFGEQPYELGMPADWHRHPLTGEAIPHLTHWSELGDFRFGDIRLLWEPARFGAVYPLVRAYWRNGDERFAEAFWQLVAAWREQNSPQSGAHWKCGQEAAVRLMAWCFGLYGFLHAASTTGPRMATLAQMIAVSAERIAANLPYALRQQNNHGISELTGLWTAGLLFPELSGAEGWRRTAAEHLEGEARALIYDDGGFCQYSVGYHRVMLHCYAWCLRLGELHGHVFSEEVRRRVARAGEFLGKICEAETGAVPVYGQNDGSWILPLGSCGRRDFRPVVQMVSVLSTGRRVLPAGPWDEDALWLFGKPNEPDGPSTTFGTGDTPVAPDDQCDPTELLGGDSGCHTLRARSGFAFMRCGNFRHRPSHADLLHVDLWWQRLNIAVDAGTFSYNAADPWCNPLSQTRYHNTVTVDGLDQMERLSRFLWSPWCESRVRARSTSPQQQVAYWEGSHDGYQRLKPPASHTRGVLRLGEDHWLVVDSLHSHAPRRYRLHWLLADLPWMYHELDRRLELQTARGTYNVQITPLLSDDAVWIDTGSVVRADAASPRGWQAPCYNQRQPALSLACEAESKVACFCTLFGPGECSLTPDGEHMQVLATGWQADIRLGNVQRPETPLIQRVDFSGQFRDRLEIG